MDLEYSNIMKKVVQSVWDLCWEKQISWLVMELI